MKTNINVIGLGFVGITTALGFAEKKFQVTCVEKNKDRLAIIKRGNIPFKEPDLKKILIKNIFKKNLTFSNTPIFKKNETNVIFICVGTPSKKNGEIDLKFVKKLIININKNSNNEKIVLVIKSTVLPGTIANNLSKLIKKKNISICSNPEFLREGYAWFDFNKTDKIVIGYNNVKDFEILKKIYKNFKGDIIGDTTDTAEYIKYLSNSLLGTLISFSNELTMLGEKNSNINIKKAFNAVKLDKRWFGSPAMISTYLHPGLGYGGYCLPKDISAINFLAKKSSLKNGILESTNNINKKILKYQVNKIIKKFKRSEKIAILGMSFKTGSDDLRGSRSLELIKILIKKGYKKIYTFDPIVDHNFTKKFKQKIYHSKKIDYDKTKKYLLCTPWKIYVQFLKKHQNLKYIDFRYKI